MNVAFRVNVGHGEGFGHAIRCMALAEQFQAHKHTVSFICNDPSLLKDFPFASYNQNCVELLTEADIIIADSYQFDAAALKKMKTRPTQLLVYFDDLMEKELPVDLIIGNAYSTASTYKKSPHTILVSGPEYVPLREQFSKCGPKSHGNKIQKLLLSCGGEDPDNYLQKILRLLKGYPRTLELHLLIGKANRHLESLKKEIALSPHHCHIHLHKQDLASLFHAMDLAITAAGTTVWELACAGTPMIFFEMAENQKKTAEFLKSKGLGISLGKESEITESSLKEALHTMESKEFRKAQSALGKGLIDGQGAKRLYTFLCQVYGKKP